MRILLRKWTGKLYLQPSGEWSADRQSAREFTSGPVAYWWAKEQRLLGVEVVLAFDDEQFDVVTMRITSPA
jgi:hypothetical protein